MDYLEYKGYKGSVEYSREDNCLVGKVQGMGKDLIAYEGQTLDEIRQDFEAGKLYFKDDPERLKTIEIIERTEAKFDHMHPNLPKEIIRTKEYVENECKKIVDQLIANIKGDIS